VNFACIDAIIQFMPVEEDYRGYKIDVVAKRLNGGHFAAHGTIRKLRSVPPAVPFETTFAITDTHPTEDLALRAGIGFAKRKIDDHIYIDKIEQLVGFFKMKKPEYEIVHDWSSGFENYRFYFRMDNANRYVLELGRELLDDWNPDEIVSHLRNANWEEVLKRHSGQGKILLFTRAGFDLPGE
jgi:hypothetical protein